MCLRILDFPACGALEIKSLECIFECKTIQKRAAGARKNRENRDNIFAQGVQDAQGGPPGGGGVSPRISGNFMSFQIFPGNEPYVRNK